MKKWLCTTLTVMLIYGALFSGIAGAETGMESEITKTAAFDDTVDHWAQDSIIRWNQRSILTGMSDGKFHPDQKITRAEWAAIINRIFQFQTEQNAAYPDVKDGEWFSKDVRIAAAAGYMKGYNDGTFRPNGKITRQEAAVTVANLLALQADNQGAAFKDESKIASWASQAIAANAQAKLISGYADGTFQPLKELTRAEAVSLLNRAFDHFGTWYGEAGTFGPSEGVEKKEGSVVVSRPGITLNNLDIAGDLIIGKGVGDGDVYLNNVTVHGNTYIYGGGEHSIHLENVVMLTVIVNKTDGTVRLVATGSSIIQEVTLQTGTNLEVQGNAAIDRVSMVSELPENSRVVLSGHFNTVNIEAKSIMVQIPQGVVENLNIGHDAADTKVETTKEASILSLILNAAASILGQGAIEKATINSPGVTLDQTPGTVTIGEDVPDDTVVNIGGLEKSAYSLSQPPSFPSGSSTGGSGSGGNSGGNGGNTGGNTGDMFQPFEGGSYFRFGLNSDVTSVTEAVYVTSPRDGEAIIMQKTINFNDPVMLEAAIQAGTAIKTPVTAGVRTELDKTGFTYFAAPKIVVRDNQGIFSSYRYLRVLDDDTKPLSFNTFGMVATDTREDFYIEYNRDLRVVAGKDLRASVTLSTYSNPEFKPLAPEDKIYIYRNKIIIEPADPFLGKQIIFKFAAELVETLDGAYQNEEYTNQPFDSRTHIQIVDPVQSNSYSATINIGTDFKFKVDQGDTVTFVSTSVISDSDAILAEIAAGRGFRYEITDSQVDQAFEVNTTGFQAGEYYLYAKNGLIITVTLVL